MIFRFVCGIFTGIAIFTLFTAFAMFTFIIVDMLDKEFKIIYIFIPFLFTLIFGLIGMLCF